MMPDAYFSNRNDWEEPLYSGWLKALLSCNWPSDSSSRGVGNRKEKVYTLPEQLLDTKTRQESTESVQRAEPQPHRSYHNAGHLWIASAD